MNDLTATLAYTQLDDFFKVRQRSLGLKSYARLDSKCRQADAKITLPEAACLLVLFQSSRVEHLKAFVDLARPWLLRLFHTLPSYKRLCAWVQKSEQLLVDFAKSSLAEPGDRLARYAIDSTRRNGVPAAGVLRTSVRSIRTKTSISPKACASRRGPGARTRAGSRA